MKNSTPQKIAYNTAMILALIILVITSALNFLINKNTNWFFVIINGLIVFTFGYFLFMNAIKVFIYKKIKRIYKSIYHLRSPESSSEKNIDLNTDIISEVHQEVIDLAEHKKEEIEELQQTAKYRREFIGNISHELKTPLFNIQGYIHTLLDGGIHDPKINKEYLYKAAKSIDRLSAIVTDLEAISKLESGDMKPEMEKFDIYKLILEIFESLEMMAETNDVKLHVKEGYNKPTFVWADSHYIRQVLVNLITNGIKYGKENGVVNISFHDMDEKLLTEVSDDGIGIIEKDLPRLFERFYSVDKSRTREKGGTGLGLSIVKHIIEAHGQSINVKSSFGKGSTFGFTLQKNR